jgi:hypothetical protein
MKRVLLFFIGVFAFYSSYSQATSASATIFTPEAYFDATPFIPTLSTYTLQSGSGETFTTCVGSQSVYWLRFNIPTTIFTKSVKVTVNTGAFSPVIDFYDGSLNPLQCVAGNILRTNATTNPIVTGQNYYIRISSTALTVGGSFQIGMEYYPTVDVRNTFTPYPPSDVDGYTACDQIRRSNLPQAVQGQRWTFTPTTSPNLGSCTYTQLANTTLALMSDISCVCYGINYSVVLELYVDNHWCGTGPARPVIMQPTGTTNITNTNFQTIPFTSNVNANATQACPGAVYEWEFVGPNGTTFYYSSTSSFAPLSSITCLRWNRIYNARVRIIACGITGAWCGITGAGSAPLTFFTPPMPNIDVPNGTPTATNDFCFAARATNAVVDVPFVEGITQYIFQFTRVQPSSPFLPIASPKIVISTTSLCPISLGNCTAGNTYRIGIKAGIGVVLPGQSPPTSACTPAQQSGDYGPWCYFSVNPGAAPVPMPVNNNEDSNVVPSEVTVIEEMQTEGMTNVSFEVYGHQEKRFLNLDLNGNEMKGTGFVSLYNINGQEVFSESLYYTDGASAVQIELPNNLTTGIYVAKVISDGSINTGKIFLSGR